MARRRRKSTSSILKSLKPSVQVTGIILILIGVIGFGVFGPVGRYIKSFGVFLFGNYFVIFDIMMIVLGMYMLFKKALPNFVNMKLIGIYLIVLSSLGILNMNHITQGVSFTETFNEFRNNYLVTISDGLFNNISLTGSGLIGLSVSWAFVALLVLLFNLDLYKFFGKLASDFKESCAEYKEERKKKREEDEQRRKEEEMNRVQVTAYDQEQEEELYNTKATKVIPSFLFICIPPNSRYRDTAYSWYSFIE